MKDSNELIRAIEPINNENIVSKHSTKNSVNTMNGILCKPLIKNQQLIKPNINDHVIVIFLDGDPQKPYYINYNLYGILNTNDFIDNLKEKGHEINILDVLDNYSLIYDKTTKCFHISNGTQDL
jgi:hypothetical protein